MRGRFDETLDDYPDTYEVFTLPNLSEDKEIEFDPMHRVWIDTKLIDAYMAPVFVGELSLRLWLAREGREHPEVERARRHRIG